MFNVKIHTNGVTRIVILIGKYAIKVPNFTYSHDNFLKGCSANWNERAFCRMFKNTTGTEIYHRVAPSYFCSWFGLIQIQARCNPYADSLSKTALEYLFNQVCTDIKSDNIGIYKGRLVCFDYAT